MFQVVLARPVTAAELLLDAGKLAEQIQGRLCELLCYAHQFVLVTGCQQGYAIAHESALACMQRQTTLAHQYELQLATAAERMYAADLLFLDKRPGCDAPLLVRWSERSKSLQTPPWTMLQVSHVLSEPPVYKHVRHSSEVHDTIYTDRPDRTGWLPISTRQLCADVRHLSRSINVCRSQEPKLCDAKNMSTVYICYVNMSTVQVSSR